MSKRDGAILEILTAEQRIEVTTLADRLGVSSVTMRKDLDALQGKGLVQREHGFALLVNPNDVSGRLARHYEEKRRIARKAAVLVPDGSTVMIESGSCCALLARELADVKSGVTIVTNSAFIAGYIRDSARVETVLLGGVAQRDSQVMVGPLVRMCAREFLVNRLFVGVDGWADGIGFTNGDQMRAEAVRAMAESAEEVVVLTESDKFGCHGLSPLRLDGKSLRLVTDAGIPEDYRSRLAGLGVAIDLA
ncbi:MAG: DeoR/GlpR transcriptional regulator [Olsenella uli]|uniref:DeoR/GlpR family DNA-binding transcription regulator n=1 Tax=Olsenella uli TaxID=133926 RepID=UPI001D303C68|nr:DeoR/GlpR family DNA-binding transcription regulator [Olsenella uli]MBS6417492.1 DeoR/GlpR transcriptional regulator [Olsenella uli]